MTSLITQYKGLRREIYVLVIGRIVTSLGSMIWPVMTLILNQKMGLSATTVAMLMITAGVIQMPLGLLGGKLADKYNKRNIIIVCDIISVFFFIACAFIPMSWTSITLMIISSSCQSMEHPSYTALIADLTESKDRERAYSLTYLGSNLGMVASPTIAGLLFVNYLWLSFLISGIAIGFSSLLIFLLIKDITPAKEEDNEASQYQKEENSDVTSFEVLRSNLVVVLFLVITDLFWSGYCQYSYLMPLELVKTFGDRGSVIYGSVFSLNCIIVVVCTPLITRLLAKFSYTIKNELSIVLLFLGFIVFTKGLGHIWASYIAITLFTLGEILATIINGPYITERIPKNHRGRINGFITVLQTICMNLSLLISGILYDNIGAGGAWSFVFAILIAGFILGLFLIGLDKKHYPALYGQSTDTND